MKLSTIVAVLGVALFVLPVPGTFVGGGIVLLGGIALRLLGK
ncbi:hypothetical protein SAMN04488063_1475 [Halopelagius inordinatus]|uniref:Uncharacterized protein n=1 Tax=Halopelagius inordinatus TaxID=553467 RepID=A0A1I2PDT7_9EURY|nr:hypothetical protein [Halopelagius inordinatus]SFG11826.1 hypothetical protein SAMN04488063_1475 [Halopelagius inordinatus]